MFSGDSAAVLKGSEESEVEWLEWQWISQSRILH